MPFAREYPQPAVFVFCSLGQCRNEGVAGAKDIVGLAKRDVAGFRQNEPTTLSFGQGFTELVIQLADLR